MNNAESYPPLPLKEWESTKKTLHRYLQIIGKIRMEFTPFQNHWWHVPLYVSTRGLTTRAIPYQYFSFELAFDFIEHRLKLSTSNGQSYSFSLADGLSVSQFYQKLLNLLNRAGIKISIRAKPFDLEPEIPFAEDTIHKKYDKEFVTRYWQILLQINRIFQIFNSDFYGKVCPIQLYWHSFDLVTTRFSGKQGPPLPEANHVEREAYSHEVISFGFWPGDETVTEPAFYSYTYPAPDGLAQTNLQPESAFWTIQNNSPLALLKYEDVRLSGNPKKSILNFLESAYRAGVRTASWDIQSLHKNTSLE